MQPFRLFLSSPGDCGEERQAVHDSAGRLNADPLVSHFTRIEVVAWDQGQGIPLELLTSEAVNKSTFIPGWRGENAARDKATQVDLIEERRAPNGRGFGGKQRISLNQCVIMPLRFR